ncbi:Nn.00g089900.m01.CDS01 [Neocucurbitaria sp. VM-36]
MPPVAGEAERPDEHAQGTKGASSITTALRQRRGRKRTGSLRKTAMARVRERSSSLRKERTTDNHPAIISTMRAIPSDGEANPLHSSYENVLQDSSSNSGYLPTSILSQSSIADSSDSIDDIECPIPQLGAPIIRTRVAPYTSTTDEDDATSLGRPSVSSSTTSLHATTQGPKNSLSRRRSNRSERRTSPVVDVLPSNLDLDDEWDYSATEWWGWIVLIVTWIVFVVGMGSCLGVWGWAWDVGETPYAPPELEDDATLPITGYYPALIVCTAVMSWVWVVVSWVGMKYFRHAKVVGDDG